VERGEEVVQSGRTDEVIVEAHKTAGVGVCKVKVEVDD
jgi:hypothetical protein